MADEPDTPEAPEDEADASADAEPTTDADATTTTTTTAPARPIPSRRVTPKGSPGATTPTTRAAARKAAAAEKAKAAAAPASTSRKPLVRKTVEKKVDTKVAARSGDPRKKAAASAADSSRYTAPIPDAYKVSPWYVPALMFGFLGLGMIIIFLNYMGWPFADASNWRLLGGLGCILAGILVATRYH